MHNETPNTSGAEFSNPGADDERRDVFAPLVDQAIVITGATAAGKSAVAVELAERMDGEILSLDSIAVYQGMDIGTAKPSQADRRRAAHHLIDLVPADQEFSVTAYLMAAHRLVAEIKSRGRQPIFVGGTPMYLKGVLRGFDPGPPPNWEFRQSIEEDVKLHGVAALYDRLRQVDPLAAHRIDRNDKRRMIRALEVARHTGVPLSHRQIQFDHAREAAGCRVFAIGWPREQLHQRINQRVQQMFDRGLVQEVQDLLTQYGTLSRTACQAVGYREVIQLLNGEMKLDETIEAVSAHTRQLARRQETWFRSFSEIRTVPADESTTTHDLVEKIHGALSLLP